jgi:hypothetical protein
MPDHDLLPIAAIRYGQNDPAGSLMREVAQVLASRGVRLGGVLQHDRSNVPDDACAMEMENLATGEHFPLSLGAGSGTDACRLDPASLAHAAVMIGKAVDDGVELVLINKFGAQEAAGAGLRDEMGRALATGVPLLTTVADRFIDDWQSFTGGTATLLEPRLEHVLRWWDEVAPGT